MAKNDLKRFITRWKNIDKFLDALIFKLCEKMVSSLKKNTPGTIFPTQWTFTISRKPGEVTAEVFNTRLGSATQKGYDESFIRIAFYLNDGTTKHKIPLVRANALHWEIDGQHYFSKGHEVKGIKASHFREKADRIIEQYKKTIPTKFAAYMNHGRLP